MSVRSFETLAHTIRNRYGVDVDDKLASMLYTAFQFGRWDACDELKIKTESISEQAIGILGGKNPVEHSDSFEKREFILG